MIQCFADVLRLQSELCLFVKARFTHIIRNLMEFFIAQCLETELEEVWLHG